MFKQASLLCPQGCVTMHFTFTASADGSRLVKCAHWVCFLLLPPILFILSPKDFLICFYFCGVVSADNSEWEFQKYGHQNVWSLWAPFILVSMVSRRIPGFLTSKRFTSCLFDLYSYVFLLKFRISHILSAIFISINQKVSLLGWMQDLFFFSLLDKTVLRVLPFLCVDVSHTCSWESLLDVLNRLIHAIAAYHRFWFQNVKFIHVVGKTFTTNRIWTLYESCLLSNVIQFPSVNKTCLFLVII